MTVLYLFLRQEEMYQVVIHNYEDKQRELMLENADLRDCLVQMQKELVTVINGEEMSNCSVSPPNVSYQMRFIVIILIVIKNVKNITSFTAILIRVKDRTQVVEGCWHMEVLNNILI